MASSSPNTNISSSTSAEDVSSNATLTTNVATSTNTATWPTTSAEGGGYDYELVDGTDSRYECPICLLCLRDPVLTTCGHRFCSSCINQWVTGENGKCPVDSVSLSHENIFPDNFTRREVMQCNAKCPITGCTSVHKIVEMEKHIETAHMGCVTNGGGGLLECPYKEVGCVVPLRQDQFERHLKNDVHHHLQLLTAAYRRLKIYSSRSNLEYSTGSSLDVFLRQDSQDSTRFLLDESLSPDDYQFRRQRSWDSVRFARKHNIRPSNLNSTWLPESDESLCHVTPLPPTLPSTSLPATATTTAASSQSPKDLKSSKTNGTGGSGGGMDQQHHLQDIFQRLVLLEQKDREKQIKIDKVEAEHASVVNLFSTSAQVIKDFNARYCHGVFLWRIPEFRKLCLEMRRNPNRILNSPGFYTDTFGYKLCLRFNLKSPSSSSSSSSLPLTDGASSISYHNRHNNDIPLDHDEHTFISFYVHFMQGEFDDTLHWPFHGDIKVMMIHPTVAEDTIQETMHSSPAVGAFAKPSLPRNPKGWGYNEFCPINKVFTNGFVKNDTLLCKVVARSYTD